MPHTMLCAVCVAALALAGGCNKTDANAVLNRLIQLPASSYTIENPAVDDTIKITGSPGGFGTLSPGRSGATAYSFNAPNADIVGAGIRFGDKGPIHVVPFEALHGLQTATVSFPFGVPDEVCKDLDKICHKVTCVESVVTKAGKISEGNLNDLVLSCGCKNSKCPGTPSLCDSCISGCDGIEIPCRPTDFDECPAQGEVIPVDAADNPIPVGPYAVGDLVALKVRPTDGHRLKSVQWNLDTSYVVANYVALPTSSTAPTSGKTTPPDLTTNPLKVHWTKANTWKVTAVMTVEGNNTPTIIDFNVDIVAPEVTFSGYPTDRTKILPADPLAPKPRLLPQLSLGDADHLPPGYTFHYRAESTRPETAGSQIALIQLAKVNDSRDPVCAASPPALKAGVKINTGNNYLLDAGLGCGDIFYSKPEPIAETFHDDSPSVWLEPACRVYSADSTFKMFAMFKSKKTTSIWVALQRVDWHWAASANAAASPAPAIVGTPTEPETRLGVEVDPPGVPTWNGCVPLEWSN